ncbi:MAG: hypothetical protein C4536_12240 [Actinobacteria bacterium]|jgi:sugar phosphate isomerase/epimerase|nr:MAG: hypothetical protein C4536_12240 [Actinomycetota bacterium]
MSKTGIKMAVALFSFMHEFRSGAYALEELVARAAETGAQAVEFLNPTHFPNWPHTTAGELERIRKVVEKEGLTVSCSGCGAYMDTAIKTGETLTEDEQVAYLKRELRFAHELACPVMVVGPNIPLEVELACLPVAEELGVKIGVEIHAPYSIDYMGEYGLTLAKLQEIDSPYFGIVPDAGAFVDRMPQRLLDKCVGMGMPAGAIDAGEDYLSAGLSLAWMKQLLAGMGAPEIFEDAVELLYLTSSLEDPKVLAPCVPHIVNVHGKFWDITGNGEEPSIAYDEFLGVLAGNGYEGYVCSEYEGWLVDTEPRGFEMVARHLALMRSCLDG